MWESLRSLLRDVTELARSGRLGAPVVDSSYEARVLKWHAHGVAHELEHWRLKNSTDTLPVPFFSSGLIIVKTSHCGIKLFNNKFTTYLAGSPDT
jgi:hypothetical protein